MSNENKNIIHFTMKFFIRFINTYKGNEVL